MLKPIIHGGGRKSKKGELNFGEGCFMDFQVSKIHSGKDPCVSSCLREIYCQPPEVVGRKSGGGTGGGFSSPPHQLPRQRNKSCRWDGIQIKR